MPIGTTTPFANRRSAREAMVARKSSTDWPSSRGNVRASRGPSETELLPGGDPVRRGATRDCRCREFPGRPNRCRLHPDCRLPTPMGSRRDRGFSFSNSTIARDPDFLGTRLRTTNVWLPNRRRRLNRHLLQIRLPAEAMLVLVVALDDLVYPKKEPDRPRHSRRSSGRVRSGRGIAGPGYREHGKLHNRCRRIHPAAYTSRPPSVFGSNSRPKWRAGSSRPGPGEVDRTEPISRNLSRLTNEMAAPHLESVQVNRPFRWLQSDESAELKQPDRSIQPHPRLSSRVAPVVRIPLTRPAQPKKLRLSRVCRPKECKGGHHNW